MVINSLTNYIYTPWGVRYNQFNWRNEWYCFLNINKKQVKSLGIYSELDYIHNCNTKSKYTTAHLLYWFDTNILQRISKDSTQTLDVRVRILCGMVNKISPRELTIPMKQKFMECIWDTYRKFNGSWIDYECLNIFGLPF